MFLNGKERKDPLFIEGNGKRKFLNYKRVFRNWEKGVPELEKGCS